MGVCDLFETRKAQKRSGTLDAQDVQERSGKLDVQGLSVQDERITVNNYKELVIF